MARMLVPVPTVAGGGGHTELKADAADAAAKEEQERIAERQRKEEKDGKDAATAAEAGAAVLRLIRAYYASKRALDADTANPTARESVTQADRALLQAGNALLAWIRGNESSRIGDNDHVVLEHARMFIAHRFESDKDVTKAVGDLLFLYRTAEALMERTRGSANEEKWMWVFNGTAFDIKGIENMQKRPVEPGGEDGKEEKRTDAPPTDALPTTPGTTGTGAGANEAFTGNGQPRALVDAPDATLVEPAHVAAADNTHLADESGTGLPGGGGRGDSDRVDVSPKAIEDFIRRVVGGIDVPVANQWVPGPDPEATGPARDALSPKASQGDGTSEDGSRVSFNTADGKGGEGGAAVPPATHNEDDESHRDGEDLVSVAESAEGPSDAPRIAALDASEHGTPRSASGALHVQVTDGRALSPGIPDQMQTMEDLYFAYVASSQRVGAHGNDEDAEEQLVAAGNAMLDWIQLHAFAEFTDSACVFSDEVCKFVNRQYRINHDARRAAECIDNLSIAMDNMPDPATDDLGDALRDVRILMEDVRRTVQQTEQERQRAVDDHAADADDADDAGDADVGDAHAALGALPVRVTSNSEDAIRKTASLRGAWLEARKRLDERVALGEPSEGADGDAQAAGENLCAWAKHGLVEYDDTAVTCLQTALNAVIVWLGATRDVDTALRWSVWVLFGFTRMFHPMGARRPYGLLAAQEMICRSVVDAQTALDTSPGGVLAAEGAGEAEFAQKTDAGMNTSYATGVCWWLREKWWEAESRDDTVLAGVERTGAGVLMLEWIECENLIDYDDAADALFTHVLEYIHWRSAEPRLDVVNLRCVRDALDNIIGPSDVSLKRQRETRLAAVVARLEQAQENAGVAVRADARDAVRDRTDARSEDDQRSKGGDADASGDEIKVLAAGTGASSTGNPVDRGSALCTRWYAAVNAPDQSGVAQAGDELLIWIAHSGLVEYDEDAQAFLEAALDVVIRRVSVDGDLKRALSGLMRIQLARNSLRGMSADGEPGRLVALKWMIGNGLYDGNRFQIDATPNGVREADFAGQADLDNVRTAGLNTMYARQVSHLLVMKWLDAQQSLPEMVGAGTMMIEWIACHDLIVYDADAARIVAAALEFIGKQKKLGEADRTTADLNCVLGALLLIVDSRDETQRDACDAMVARVRLLLGHVQGGRSPLRKHSEDELAMENITRRAEADAVAHAEREATAEEEARVAAEADAAKKAKTGSLAAAVAPGQSRRGSTQQSGTQHGQPAKTSDAAAGV